MTHLPASPAEILLVEDDENYAYLAQRAFGKAKLPANLHHVNNGKKCLQFLRQQFPYRSAPVPDIILLDLDMPVMDGREVLAEIVKDESLKHLAVVMLTSGDEQNEVLQMYQLRCNSYICKPVDFDTYADMIKRFADYWLSVVVLPTQKAGSSQTPALAATLDSGVSQPTPLR